MFNPNGDIDIIRIRVRPEVKKRARAVFAARGLATSEAIKIFLCKAIIRWAYDREPRWPGTKDMRILNEFKKAKSPCYDFFDEILDEIEYETPLCISYFDPPAWEERQAVERYIEKLLKDIGIDPDGIGNRSVILVKTLFFKRDAWIALSPFGNTYRAVRIFLCIAIRKWENKDTLTGTA